MSTESLWMSTHRCLETLHAFDIVHNIYSEVAHNISESTNIYNEWMILDSDTVHNTYNNTVFKV